ncbi:MAG: pyridoxamine 5'-phosphate oxidase family protein [Pseudomonadales bacterium]|nr:pyridoxamine 5'-phosphate oxidase family protein [Pseudomonadales bacterium]
MIAYVRHTRERASYLKEDVYHLVDDLKLGHVAFTIDSQITVVPITIWRVGEFLYFHCANKGRMQKHLESGREVCVSFAECTEWVMAKSAYHHSANYRSAVLFCRGERVIDEDEFDAAFKVIINQIESDRWNEVRTPNKIERKATALMKLTIDEGSFKSRTGEPSEEEEDLSLPVWHGTLPVCPFHDIEK